MLDRDIDPDDDFDQDRNELEALDLQIAEIDRAEREIQRQQESHERRVYGR